MGDSQRVPGFGFVSRRTRVLFTGLMVMAVVLAPVPFTAQPAQAATPSVDSATPFVGVSMLRCATSPNCLARFYDTSDNLAHPTNGARPAVAKDVIAGYPDIHDPTFVNDGYYGNGASWIAGTANSWVKIDLGVERCVESVRFGRDRLGGFNDRDPGQIRIYTAATDNAYAPGDATNDAAEYTVVFETNATYSGAINGAETLKASFSPTAARYVKFEVASAGAAIDELEVAEAPLGSCSALLPLVHFDAGDLGGVDNATGDVELESSVGDTGRFVEFDAVAGTLHWRRSSDGSEFDAEITSYLVDGNYAEMLGTVTTSTFSNIFPGFTFRFQVWDGTPDTAAWQWLTGLTASQTYDVIAGDLAVRDSSADGDAVAAWAGQTATGTPTYLADQTPNGSPAVEFDGGGDRFANNLLLPASPTGDWIVAAVIKADNIGAYHNLVDDDAQNRPMLWIDPSFRYELNFAGGTGAKAVGTGVGGWDVVIADSRLNQLYVNSPVPNASGGGAIPFNAAETFDFFHRDGGQTFRGQVAELRLYSDAAAFGGDFAALYSELAAKHLRVSPIEYSMTGGNGTVDSGAYDYFDDLYGQTVSGQALSGGLGDLTDGVVATLSWNGALPASKDPYVGWLDFTAPAEFPPITFTFAELVDLERIRVWVSGASGGSVYPPTAIDVTMGGVLQSYPVTPPAGNGPFAIDLDMGAPPTELPPDSTVVIAPQGDEGWIFISEVEFYGETLYSIQSAIDAASPGDIITVPAGSYNETLYISKDVTLQGPDPGTGDPLVTIDASGLSDVVVFVDAEATVVLRDVVITGGDGLDAGGVHNAGDLTLDGVIVRNNTSGGNGGGIFNDGGHLELIDSQVVDNTAGGSGGGIATLGSFGGCEICTLVLTDTVVSGNSAMFSGGGIYGELDPIAITGSHIFDNSAGAQGGGIANSYADMTITNSTIGPANVAWQGGGISNGEGTAELINVTVSGNEAEYGGGIYEWSGVTTILDHVTIAGNVAHVSGAGTYQDYGNIEATNSIIAGNTVSLLQDGSFEYGLAPPGGNYLIVPPADGLITLGGWTYHYVYCSLGCGGGQSYPLLGAPWGPGPAPDGSEVLNLGRSFDPGRIEQTFTTEVGKQYDVSLWAINAAGFLDGQGRARVYSTGGTHINSVFTVGYTAWQQFSYSFTATDTATTIELQNLGSGGASSHDALVIDDVRVEAAQDCAGMNLSETGTLDASSANNVIGVGDGCGLTDGVNGNTVGVDALLGPLAANGGLTPTHALDAASPAIDAAASVGTSCAVATDQRGEARPQGPGCDAGAFEAPQPADPTVDLVVRVADPLAAGAGLPQIGAGGSEVALDGLFQFLTDPVSSPISSVPISSVPISSVPISSVPISSVPISSVPISSVPISSVPISSVPISSVPISSVPISSVPISSVPISSVNTPQPASTGACGTSWQTLLEGTPFAGLPLQTIILQDVLDPASYPGGALPECISLLVLGNVDLSSNEVGSLSLASISLGATGIGDLPIGSGDPYADWCAALDTLGYSCATEGWTPSTPVAALDIAGVPISSVPISSVPISSVYVSTPISSVPISSVPISSVPISSVQTMFDCVPADCSDIPPAATFGDLVALGWLKPTATFADFFATQLPPEYFPWEDLPLDQIPLQLFQNPATASLVTYEVGFTLEDVPGAQPAVVAVTLPDGFVYAPGTTSFDGSPLADTALTVDLSDLQWDVGPLGSGTYLLSFQAHASLDLGVKRISASVEVPSLSLVAEVLDRAPILVVENFEGETVPVAGINTLYLAHIASDGDVDLFDIPVPTTEGTLLRVSLSNLTQDNDMVLYRPTSDALSAFATSDTAQAAQPIEDDGINGINGKDTLAPETLQDIPISSVPISSVSATRGTADEEAEATVAAADIASGGTYQIQVSGYNGLTSRDPYVLIVEQVAQTIGSCPPKTWPYSDPGATAQTISLGALAGVDTVVFVDQRRLARQYGSTAAADVVADLTTLVAALNGGTLSGHGLTAALIDIEAVIGHDLAGPLDFWDDDPCNVDRANNVVTGITAMLAELDAATPLRFVTIVGSDELIPMARVPDLTKLSNEKDYAGYFDVATTLNGTFGAGYVLTDDAYGDRNPIEYLDRQLFVPDFAVGRLIETPTEIRGAVALFLSSGGSLDPQTSLVTGYDFLNDGAATVANVLDDVLGTPADRTLINDRWTAAGLRAGLLPPDGTGTDASADVIAVNAHFDHYRSQPARTSSPFQIIAYASRSEVQPSDTTTINVEVRNLSSGPITLTSLVVTDPDAAICPALVGVEIAAGAQLTCTFDVTVGATVGSYARTVLAEALGAADESGSLAAGTVAIYDEAVIALVASNTPAALQMRATPVSDQPSAPSAGVTYEIAITNATTGEVFISAVNDPTGTVIAACDTAAPLAAGATLECSFTETVTGTPGDRVARTFTASGTDGSGAAVGAGALATVEFLGLVDTGHLVADKLAGSIIFSMGCHAGLNVPDSIYSIAGDPRAADWAQQFAAQGAIYFANTGFGYGDTASVALSERLMALFAQRLDGSVFAGEAGMYAKQSYVGGLGLYGVYDEKVLAEAVFYGIPFYFVGEAPTGVVAPPPLPISEDAATGLPSSSLSLTSIALDSTTDPVTGGSVPEVDSYELDLGAGPTVITPDESSLLTVHYRPLQPLITIDVTPDDPTVVPHGAMITHLESGPDQVGLRAKFMRPIIDNGQDEPELVFGETIFPSVLQSLTTYETPNGTRHNLNLAPGQFFMIDADAGTGVQRNYVAMDAVVRYSDIPAFDPPTIRRTQAVVDGGTVIFRIEVEPADGRTVVEANVLFKDESGDWTFAPLALISGNVWGAQVSGIVGERVEFFTQAGDDAGNVAVSTNKAEFYVARLLTGSLESGVAVEGDTVTLTSFFADPAIGTTHAATVDWGDGTTTTLLDVESPFSAVHTYPNEGEYTILIRVVSNGTGADAYDESAVTSATIENAPPVVNAGPPQSATIPGTVQFVATFSDPGTDDVHTATIDWGDGTSSPGTVRQSQGRIVASHTYTGAASQTYVITVTVSDGTDTTSASKVLNATGTPPPVTIDAQSFSVVEGSVASVSGAFGGPGPITITGPPGLVDNGGGTWTWTRTPPDGPATIPVTITATGPGGTTTDTFTVTVTNANPTVSVSGAPPAEVPAGTVVNLLATATDPAGTADPLSYVWSITGPDGPITRTTAQATVTTTPGSYSASVTVTDGDGGSATSSVVSWIVYAPVAVNVTGLPTGPVAAGTPVQLQATPSGGLTPLTTQWKVNGTTAVDCATPPTEVCVVDIPTATPGQVSATVTVTDSAGATATASGVITVYEPLAVVNAAPDDPVGVNEGETAIVSGAFSGSGNIGITADTPGLVDNGDGFWTWSAYQPDGPANFTVTVTATGPFDQVVTDTFDVAVSNLDPTVSVDGAPALPVAVGTEINLEAVAADVIDDPLTYTWEITSPSGTTNTNSPPQITVGPLDLGEYTVTVTADDGDGGVATDTVTLIAGPPQITAITVDPVEPAPLGTAVTLTVDYDLYADHATVVWGDGTPPVSLTPSGGTFSVTHTYVDTGVFQAQVSVSAQTVGVDQGVSDFIVVYGTTGTSVRGNKEYVFEAGELTADPAASGEAKFGFNVKPKNDGSLKGSVKLDLKDETGSSGDHKIQLRSTDLVWLATSNDWAQVFGEGTVRCLPDGLDDGCSVIPVEFKLTVIDGDVGDLGDGVDRIRISIFEPGNPSAVIYDNEGGAAAARPLTPIIDGKIVIKNPNLV